MAAAHHERLDGGGYPRGDIFDAITAERPYRGAIPIPRTLEMMVETVGSAIDAACFVALRSARLPTLAVAPAVLQLLAWRSSGS